MPKDVVRISIRLPRAGLDVVGNVLVAVFKKNIRGEISETVIKIDPNIDYRINITVEFF